MQRRKRLRERSSNRKMNKQRIRRKKKWISLENNSRRNRNTKVRVCLRLPPKTKRKVRSGKFQNSKGRSKNRSNMR